MHPPFPYFGGKRRAAPDVWRLLGNVSRYVEPFFGSGAVLLGNPRPPLSELVNDRSHFIANVWRGIQQDPATVERLVSAPASEVELRARAAWLATEGAARLAALDWSDLSACDAEVAGVWLWQACVAVKSGIADLHRGNHGRGMKAATVEPRTLDELSERLARVQILCGDWSRVVTPAALTGCGAMSPVGVFLDPPYGEGSGVDYEDGTGDVAADVWRWALENGENPRLRIVVAGYDDGREVPDGWQVVERREKGGYGNRGANENRHRERLWASPHCVRMEQLSMFGGAA